MWISATLQANYISPANFLQPSQILQLFLMVLQEICLKYEFPQERRSFAKPGASRYRISHGPNQMESLFKQFPV